MAREVRHIHLQAMLGALALCGLLLVAALGVAQCLEQRYLDALIPRNSSLKDQGLLLQRAAFERDDVLPLYGSSELLKTADDKASLFFKRAPTDFTVSPVGKAGTTSLIVAEKLAAVGPQLRGRKVAVSLSPSFFFSRELKSSGYSGNFSPLLASESIFATELSLDLRRDLARRMAQFHGTLKSRPLLRFAVQHLQTGRPRDQLLYDLALPVGWAFNAVVRLQDRIQTGLFVAEHLHRGRLKSSPRRPADLDWDSLVERWAARSMPFRPRSQDRDFKPEKPFAGDAQFVSVVENTSEWSDLALLVRVLRELGAQPLILSIPINGVYFEETGISATARARYYDLLEEFGERENVSVLDFREHEMDPKFFADTHDHLSPKGWIYFDEALDEFFHGRPFSFVSR